MSIKQELFKKDQKIVLRMITDADGNNDKASCLIAKHYMGVISQTIRKERAKTERIIGIKKLGNCYSSEKGYYNEQRRGQKA